MAPGWPSLTRRTALPYVPSGPPCPITASGVFSASPPSAKVMAPGIGCVVDGCPPRIPLEAADIQAELDRRRPGVSRFTTQRREPDEARILSGVMMDEATGRQVTTGTPIGIFIDNVDQRSKDYSEIKDKYRPGHADYAYDAKYGDPRLSRRRPRLGARDGGAGRSRRDRPQGDARRQRSRRAGADGETQDRPDPLGLGRGRAEPVLLPRRRRRRALRRTISTTSARPAPRSAR